MHFVKFFIYFFFEHTLVWEHIFIIYISRYNMLYSIFNGKVKCIKTICLWCNNKMMFFPHYCSTFLYAMGLLFYFFFVPFCRLILFHCSYITLFTRFGIMQTTNMILATSNFFFPFSWLAALVLSCSFHSSFRVCILYKVDSTDSIIEKYERQLVTDPMYKWCHLKIIVKWNTSQRQRFVFSLGFLMEKNNNNKHW